MHLASHKMKDHIGRSMCVFRLSAAQMILMQGIHPWPVQSGKSKKSITRVWRRNGGRGKAEPVERSCSYIRVLVTEVGRSREMEPDPYVIGSTPWETPLKHCVSCR